MISRFHQPIHTAELLEFVVFLRLERVLFEKWNDASAQICSSPHTKRHSIAVIPPNHAATEKAPQFVKDFRIAFVLHHGEFRKHLIAARHVDVSIDRHMKTAFTVHETCDPLFIELHWPIPNVKSLRVPAAARAFPADCPLAR